MIRFLEQRLLFPTWLVLIMFAFVLQVVLVDFGLPHSWLNWVRTALLAYGVVSWIARKW